MKRNLIVWMFTALVLGSCSKDEETKPAPTNPTEQTPENPSEPGNGNEDEEDEPEDAKVVENVFQKLIENFKGPNGKVVVNTENNNVVFGIPFTAEKDLLITKVRAATGTIDTKSPFGRKIVQMTYGV